MRDSNLPSNELIIKQYNNFSGWYKNVFDYGTFIHELKFNAHRLQFQFYTRATLLIVEQLMNSWYQKFKIKSGAQFCHLLKMLFIYL